jgi:two-component system sensor histidine kinase CpxA
MRSLFLKILLWFWITLMITIVGSAMISALSVHDEDSRSPVARLVQLQMEEARWAWETGGRTGLSEFVDRIRRIYGGEAVLTDDAGRDLLTGQDRSDLVRRARRRPGRLPFRFAPAMVVRAADDGRYWYFLVIGRGGVGGWFLSPEHLWVLGAGVLFCYLFAFHLTAPLRKLQKAVERFGHGDLSARAGSTRKDELGQLARTFDQMAGRIETLLTAERRLLLDISHELRSPLARLGVAAELARSGDPNPHLDRIQKESDRLNSLVGELLQVTRAEGDPSTLRAEAVRLDDLLALVVEDAALEAQARGVQVSLTASGAVFIQGDAELLRRAVENVIRNAIRYAPQQTAVEVALAERQGRVVVTVRDYGPGVPEGSLGRLFDAFYRVEGDRDRASGGVGLGLSIARRAIELHKGKIRARNAAPGLAVEIDLPAAV